MAVTRAQFAGTHLENAPQWLLEIEALTMGGWKLTPLPVVKIKEEVTTHKRKRPKEPGVGRPPSAPNHYAVERRLRIAEPRAAPIAQSPIRHHHFEQKTILASRTKGKGVAEKRAAYCEGYGASDALISRSVRATNEAAYIEGRQSADEERVCYVTATTGDSYHDRLIFWQKANDNAHFVRSHTVTVMTRGVEDVWDRLAKNPRMPEPLREALAAARANVDGCATIEVNDAGSVRRWLKKGTRSFPTEIRDHVAVDAPHNGRVAYSITGQFPHDMSSEGMKDCLDKLVNEFTRRNIPSQAVIHEPTAKNSVKNWHFHLLYYAGQAELMPDGRWSFEKIKVRNKWRTLVDEPLKRMPRHDDVGAKDWIEKTKARWRDIINAQAKREGIATRFTNETNKTRGLGKAQTRVSPGRQALRKQGYFSDSDLKQNCDSWRAWRQRTADRFRRPIAALAARHARVSESAASSKCAAAREIVEALGGDEEMLRRLDDLVDQATRAAMLYGAITSGPKEVLTYYRARANSIATQKRTQVRGAKIAEAEAICEETERYLKEIHPCLQHLAVIRDQAVKRLKVVCTAIDQRLQKQEIDIASIARDRAVAAHEQSLSVHPAQGGAYNQQAVDSPLTHSIPGPGVVDESVSTDARKRREAAERQMAASIARAASDNLEKMMLALAMERTFLIEQKGRRVVPEAVLVRFSVSALAVQDEQIQNRLHDIAVGQMEELMPLTSFVQRNQHMVVPNGEQWALSTKAPVEMRQIAENWAHEPVVKGLLQRIGIANVAALDGREAHKLTKAAAQRQRYMNAWNAARLHHDVLGNQHNETVGSRIAAKEERRELRRRPPPFGSDMGR